MKRGRLIAFSGVDCAGKSTQIKLLARSLELAGERPSISWFRPGYSRELDTLRAWVRRARPSALPKLNDQRREAQFSRPNVRRAWLGAAISDTLLQLGIKLRVRLASGQSVICDRYLLDALIDLGLRFPELSGLTRRAEPLLHGACPRPERHFLLLIGRDEVMRRILHKPEDYPEAAHVRAARIEAYTALRDSRDLIAIDAERATEAVHAAIMAKLS